MAVNEEVIKIRVSTNDGVTSLDCHRKKQIDETDKKVGELEGGGETKSEKVQIHQEVLSD